MSNVSRLPKPPMREYEFTVTGRIIVAAHCSEDAEEELTDILSEVFIDFTTNKENGND